MHESRTTRTALRHRGFTLIEAALVMTIVSVGVLAMLQLLATGSVVSADSITKTTAMNLARNIREMSLNLPCNDPTTPTNWGLEAGETLATLDDLDDLHTMTFDPPIDARRQVVGNMPGWKQVVFVNNVDPNKVTMLAPNGSTPAMLMTCVVSHNGTEVYRMRWHAFDTRD